MLRRVIEAAEEVFTEQKIILPPWKKAELINVFRGEDKEVAIGYLHRGRKMWRVKKG